MIEGKESVFPPSPNNLLIILLSSIESNSLNPSILNKSSAALRNNPLILFAGIKGNPFSSKTMSLSIIGP